MEGAILYGSASTTRIFGYQPEELVGRNCLDLIHPEDRAHSRLALREVVDKPKGPLEWDARVCHKDGKYRWVESTVANLLAEPEVQALVMHQRDIDIRKAAEVERQRQADELARSNLRLEEFAYTAAHDLREPLRSVSLFTQMLFEKKQMDDADERMAKFVVDGVARMFTLIDDLLLFARSGIHEPLRRVYLNHAAELAVQNLELAIKTCDAKLKIDQLPMVLSNEAQLVRLFQNLIGNALKYRSDRPLEIHIGAERRGPDWVVRVEDNGVGIALEDQARVFMPFVRLANKDVPGTGLGLAVCKKTVEGLGGKIWVESTLGAGSTFCFTTTPSENANPAPKVPNQFIV